MTSFSSGAATGPNPCTTEASRATIGKARGYDGEFEHCAELADWRTLQGEGAICGAAATGIAERG